VLRAREDCPMLVGIFVDEIADTIAELLDSCRLDLAQLSGHETPNSIGDPDSPLFGRSFKALRPTNLAEAEAEAEWYLPPVMSPGAPSLLIDAFHPDLPGGTGLKADWAIAAELAKTTPRLMLAGGLNPENVTGAILRVRPFAVDVSGGVETQPGRKDHALVRAFIKKTKGSADNSVDPD